MTTLSTNHPTTTAVTQAIQTGDFGTLKQLLSENPGLATTHVRDEKGACRSLLHVATDWPGHFPNVAASIRTLIAAGADVNARFVGSHTETPLHWAASADDVEALGALLDAGADIEAAGSVLGGGPPLANAIGFRQWKAAHRLVERGAQVTLSDAAALGLMDRLEAALASRPHRQAEIDRALWGACHGGQRAAAELLLSCGADINWVPGWEQASPLDAARRARATDLVQWLLGRGAKPARELR